MRAVESLRRSLFVCLVVAAALPAAGAAKAKPTPVIFVHGGSGSAQQFESDAMRFTSNGFPQGRLFAYEYDTSGSSNDAAIANLDGFIASVKAATGAAQVDVLAHSRGTTVMHTYLGSSPERAASVRRYVNFDGRTAASPPGGVPTLAIWGEGDPGRVIGGAENVRFPNKAHTEVTTSRESFAAVYEFLNGAPPETRNVLPEKPSKVTVSGARCTSPPTRAPRAACSRSTSSTRRPAPGADRRWYSLIIGADGAFGPLKLNGRKRYEFALTRAGLGLHGAQLPGAVRARRPLLPGPRRAAAAAVRRAGAQPHQRHRDPDAGVLGRRGRPGVRRLAARRRDRGDQPRDRAEAAAGDRGLQLRQERRRGQRHRAPRCRRSARSPSSPGSTSTSPRARTPAARSR